MGKSTVFNPQYTYRGSVEHVAHSYWLWTVSAYLDGEWVKVVRASHETNRKKAFAAMWKELESRS